jgi:hypothetical protein
MRKETLFYISMRPLRRNFHNKHIENRLSNIKNSTFIPEARRKL